MTSFRAVAAISVFGFAASMQADAIPSEAAGAASTVPLICEGYGPQSPRDLSTPIGATPVAFPIAPASTEMNLCNIHAHSNAEHKGPGFSVFVGDDANGGYACNKAAELIDLYNGRGAFSGVPPGRYD